MLDVADLSGSQISSVFTLDQFPSVNRIMHILGPDFRKKSLRELKKVKEAWDGLPYDTARRVLIVMPSAPPLPAPIE